MVFVIGILTLLLPEKGLPIIRFSHSVLLQTQPQSCTRKTLYLLFPWLGCHTRPVHLQHPGY